MTDKFNRPLVSYGTPVVGVTKAYVRANYIESEIEEDIDLKLKHRIKNVPRPENDLDAVSKIYVHNHFLKPDMGNKSITNLEQIELNYPPFKTNHAVRFEDLLEFKQQVNNPPSRETLKFSNKTGKDLWVGWDLHVNGIEQLGENKYFRFGKDNYGYYAKMGWIYSQPEITATATKYKKISRICFQYQSVGQLSIEYRSISSGFWVSFYPLNEANSWTFANIDLKDFIDDVEAIRLHFTTREGVISIYDLLLEYFP